MLNKPFFFSQVRSHLFDGKLTQSQVDGLNTILSAWEAADLDSAKDDRWLAYMLATTHHETDRTMRPIEEYGKGRGKKYGQRFKMSGQPYTDTEAIFYGRGYVQLTWYENYEKAGRILGLDLLHQPELAMRPGLAATILIRGMVNGWFTTRKLADYFTPTKTDWAGARRIINGIDKAQLIAGHATRYYAAISHIAVS